MRPFSSHIFPQYYLDAMSFDVDAHTGFISWGSLIRGNAAVGVALQDTTSVVGSHHLVLFRPVMGALILSMVCSMLDLFLFEINPKTIKIKHKKEDIRVWVTIYVS